MSLTALSGRFLTTADPRAIRVASVRVVLTLMSVTIGKHPTWWPVDIIEPA